MRKKIITTVNLQNKAISKTSETLSNVGVLHLEKNPGMASADLISALIDMGVIDNEDQLVSIKITVQA